MKRAPCTPMIVALICASCIATSGQADLVLRRAAFDLQCPDGQLQVSNLGHNAFGVVGCGKRAAYVVDCKNAMMDSCTAIMNSGEKRGTAESR